MTKEVPQVEIQRLMHSMLSRGKNEKPARKGILSVSEKARVFAGAILGLHSDDEDEKNIAREVIREILPNKPSGGKFLTFEELNEYVKSQGENCPKELRFVRNDITIGFAVAVQLIVDSEIENYPKDFEKRKVSKSLIEKKFYDVERLVLGEDAVKLKGVTGTVERGGSSLIIITTPELGQVLDILQTKVTYGGRFKKNEVQQMEKILDGMYRNPGDIVRPGEIALVQRYLSWALEDVENEQDSVQESEKTDELSRNLTVDNLVEQQMITNQLLTALLQTLSGGGSRKEAGEPSKREFEKDRVDNRRGGKVLW